jgi:hypothetical protein
MLLNRNIDDAHIPSGRDANVSHCAMLFHKFRQAKVTYKVLLVTLLAGYYLRISIPLGVCHTQDG